MRIRTLELRAYGPFSGRNIDLSIEQGTVNVVFGENEAGKSSALRAVEGFFFGIADRTSDDHVHNYEQLRIGAQLELADGTRAAFIRRKGKKNTLSNESGVVLDEALEPFLCGVSQSGFEALFCLSYQRLNEGSKNILEAGGELGKLLFEARSDLSLRTIQAALAKQMANLYTGSPKSKAAIDDALRTVDAQRKVTRRGDVSEYKEIQNRLASLTAKTSEIKQNLDKVRVARLQLNRYLNAQPLVRSIIRAQEALGGLGVLPNVGLGFPSQFSTLQLELSEAQRIVENATLQSQLIRQRIEAIRVDNDILLRREQIEGLNMQVQQMRSHLADIPSEAKKVTEGYAEARSKLASVRPGEEPEVANLQVGHARQRIQQLGQEKARLDEELRNAQSNRLGLLTGLTRAESELERIAEIQVSQKLAAAVAGARNLGDIEARLESKRAENKSLRAACEQLKAQCDAGAQTFEQFVRTVAPSKSVIKEFEQRFRAIEDQLTQLRQSESRLNSDRQTAESEKRAFVLGGSVPTESELSEIRVTRDGQWREIKCSFESTPIQPVPAASLTLFEESIASADTVSDRLRREADRVASLTAIESRIRDFDLSIRELLAAIEAVTVERKTLNTEWLKRWEQTNVHVETPTLMLEWRDRFDALSTDILRMSKLDDEVDELNTKIAMAKEALAASLPTIDSALPLAVALAEADALIRTADESKGRRTTLIEQIRANKQQLEEISAAIDAAQIRLVQWDIDWKSEISCLQLSRIPTPTEAFEAVNTIDSARERLEAAHFSEKRVKGMERDYQAFSDAVTELVQAIAPQFQGLTPLDAVQNLVKLLNESTQADATIQSLGSQLSEQMSTLDGALANATSTQSKLEELCRLAETETVDALAAMVDNLNQSFELGKRIDELKDQLATLASGTPIEAFIDEVAGIDADIARVQLEQLKIDDECLTETLEQLNKDFGVASKDLEILDSTMTQIDSQILAESALAKVRSSVRPYLIYMLAESLIRAQIEEFRRANQGPILTKAGEIFSVLTDGSFSELTAEVDDKDQPVLVAVRISKHTGAEERLKVEALSSATRIGLYLALRLACVYHHVDRREGLPFIADDILLDFDDRRSRRVMEELGRLADRTQVLLFTHHKHLATIGEEVLGPRCAVQNLAS